METQKPKRERPKPVTFTDAAAARVRAQVPSAPPPHARRLCCHVWVHA